MSLNVVPVCANCRKSSPTVSASCTKCLRICCAACFSGLVSSMLTASVDVALLTARICSKCNDAPAANGTARNETDAKDQETITTGSAADKGLCLLHGKTRTLYCVNCSVAICASCILLGEPHDFHRVDNLTAVYLDKATRIGTKMIRAEQLNDDLHAGTAVYKMNLELMQKEEDSVLEEIETMVESSKLELSRITRNRKKILQEKLNVPVMNGAILKNLRDDARKLSPYELLEQLPAFENKYDGLIAQRNDVTLQKIDDIHCHLIPQYRWREVVYREFVKAANNDAFDVILKAAYDVEWTLTVRKTEMLQIEPSVDDAEIMKFRHMLFVSIAHPVDYTKTINQSFELEAQNNTFDVVHSSHLVKEGFCSGSGHLKMRIGIRCVNALVEKQLLDYQYCLLGNYVSMYYHPKLSELNDDEELESSQLKDDKNRSWALTLQLFSKANDVGLFVDLKKGSSTHSDIFIELKHTDPARTILRRTSNDYDKTDYYDGWPSFVKFNTLKNDAGFHPDGRLHIRFGVRPSPSLTKSPAASPAETGAANA